MAEALKMRNLISEFNAPKYGDGAATKPALLKAGGAEGPLAI